MPSVELTDFSGLSAGLPAKVTPNCFWQSVKLPVVGQRSGSLSPPP